MLDDIAALDFINCDDFTWADSIAVVGNSGILKHRNDAEDIDSHTHVMRFNHALVDGFEDVCGTKTTFRFINEHSLNHHDDRLLQELRNDFSSTQENYIDDFENLNVIIKFHGEGPSTNCQHAIDRLCLKNNVASISPQLFRISSQILGKSPSAGFLGVMVALKYYNNIGCFGFNFNQNKQIEKHYFEDGAVTGGTHDFSREHEIIKELHTTNQLSLFL